MWRTLSIALLALALSGCGAWGVYKIDIQQGNVVTAQTLAKVKVGMTRGEVRNALGSPLLTDVFHADRWDYYFSNQKSGRELERHRITLFFKDERLARIDGSAPASVAGEMKK
jgi:outer membrane protein assembly factor BamE